MCFELMLTFSIHKSSANEFHSIAGIRFHLGFFFIFNLISDSFHCCLLLLRILNLFRLEEMLGGCLIQLRAMTSQVLNISKGEDAAGSLSNFFPILYCPHCDDFPYRISLPATCVHRLLLFAVHFQEKSGSFFSLTTHYVTEDSN